MVRPAASSMKHSRFATSKQRLRFSLWIAPTALCLPFLLLLSHQKKVNIETADPSEATHNTIFHTTIRECRPGVPSPSHTAPTTLHQLLLDQKNDSSPFRSESGEDRYLLKHFFPNLCHGTYLEIGGHDGWKVSNTYAFHKLYNWTGTLIELVPDSFAALQKNRPDDVTLHAAVCATPRTVHYAMGSNRSKGTTTTTTAGVWEFMSDSFRKTWYPQLNASNVAALLQPVTCRPLRDLLFELGVTFVDMWSLDVEGGEWEVLKSVDFDVVAFGMILVEADRHDPERNLKVRSLLEKQRYVFLGERKRSYWFVHANFDQIYGRPIPSLPPVE